MKTLSTIVKILTALAAVAGAIYVAATYGDRIVAWAKKLMASMPKCPCCENADVVDAQEFADCHAPAEEAPEAAPAEEAPAEEAPVQEEPAAEEIQEPAVNEPVAEEGDFAL